jgi:hypothetical protein
MPPATPIAARPRTLLKKVNGFNGLRGCKSRSSIPAEQWRAIVEVEIFDGRRWRGVVSSGGVACEVSNLRPRALVEKGVNERRRP